MLGNLGTAFLVLSFKFLVLSYIKGGDCGMKKNLCHFFNSPTVTTKAGLVVVSASFEYLITAGFFRSGL
jgi:hypothetical protein